MKPLLPHSILTTLLVGALGLPVALVVVYGASRLLAALGDVTGGEVLQRIAQAGGILWVINLVLLVIVQALSASGGEDR